MAIQRQLTAMARVARAQGDTATALDLARVAQWAKRFSGFHARPIIGPAVPSIACEHARVTGAALQAACDRGAAHHAAMIVAWKGI